MLPSYERIGTFIVSMEAIMTVINKLKEDSWIIYIWDIKFVNTNILLRTLMSPLMLGAHRQGIQLELINFIGDDINPYVGIQMPLGGIKYHIYI